MRHSNRDSKRSGEGSLAACMLKQPFLSEKKMWHSGVARPCRGLYIENNRGGSLTRAVQLCVLAFSVMERATAVCQLVEESDDGSLPGAFSGQ